MQCISIHTIIEDKNWLNTDLRNLEFKENPTLEAMKDANETLGLTTFIL